MTIENDNSPWEEQDDMEQYVETANEAAAESEAKAAQGADEIILDKIYAETDLIKRARLLAINQIFDWPDVKTGPAPMYECVINPRDDSNRLEFLSKLFAQGSGRVPHPFFDMFSAQIRDHEGNELNERNSHAAILAHAMRAAGLKNQSFQKIDEAYKYFANSITKNSLIDRFEEQMVDFDGHSRLDHWLVNFFRLKPNEYSRTMSRYFWMSLYKRITSPGANAPISISLIGAQGVGKTYFSVRICQALTGNPQAVPAPLNLSDIERSLNDWLRRITGRSVIANIGEMRGYKKTDVETVKEFTTRTADNFNHKYGAPIDVPRQWVIIADANSYEGFNRDETGNRRFAPLFVNQGEDEGGQPWWPTSGEDKWQADFTDFDKDFWQIMAECRYEDEMRGDTGYRNLVQRATDVITEFSTQEMRYGRGVIRDQVTEDSVANVLYGVEIHPVNGTKRKGFVVSKGDFNRMWPAVNRGNKPNPAAVKRSMRQLGWEEATIAYHGKSYYLPIKGVEREMSEKDIVEVRYAAFSGATDIELGKNREEALTSKSFMREVARINRLVKVFYGDDTF